MSVEVLDKPELQTPFQIADKVLEMSDSDIPRPRKMRILMSYANHPNDRVRATALDSLALVISPELVSFYLPYLSDLSFEVRGNAITYLATDSVIAETYSEEILEAMNSLLQTPSEIAHETLLGCLSKLNRSDYAQQLADLARLANKEIQQQALQLLRSWSTKSSELIDLIEKTENFIGISNSSLTKRSQPDNKIKSNDLFLDAQEFLHELKDVLSSSNNNSKKALLSQIRNYEVLLDETELFEILKFQLTNEKDIDCLALMIEITRQLSNIDHWEILNPFLQNENIKLITTSVRVLSERNDMRILPMLMEVINEIPLSAPKINLIINGIPILKKKRPDLAVLAIEKIIQADNQNSLSNVNKILKDWLSPPAELSAVLIRCYLNRPNQKLHNTIHSYLECHSTPWDLVLIDNLSHLALESEARKSLEEIKEKLIKKHKSQNTPIRQPNYKNNEVQNRMTNNELFWLLLLQTSLALFTYLVIDYFVIG